MTVDIIEQSYCKPVRKIPPTHTLFFSSSTNNSVVDKEKKMCVEGGKFLTDTLVDSYLTVQSGLDFILSHFKEPLFPRKVSTASTNNGQHRTFDKGHAMTYFEGALGLDCRIAAFYPGQINPDLVFLDLDACNFPTMRAFKTALTHTLKRIKDKLGGYPTVLWSGRGFHIIQPIDCPVNLDEIKEFAALTDSPNNKFLQFAERYLTGNRQDSGHHPAIKSCMLRIPHSFNFKCREAGIDAEVKIIQRWNGFRPDYRLLIGSFYADLVGKNQEVRRRSKPESARYFVPGSDYGPISWIEKLLQQIPIPDYRKHTRDLILVPYLVLQRGMTDVDQITEIIMQWADKCAELYRLEPTRHEYQKRIRSRIYEVMRDKIPHMSFTRLQEENAELAQKLCIMSND